MALLVPDFLQTRSYSAERLRNAMFGPAIDGEGIIAPGSFKAKQRAAGANMSVDVAAGRALVRGDTSLAQGLYHVVNDATVNVAVAASHATNPRIDRVVLRVFDSLTGDPTDDPAIQVISGTATSGATLLNLNGAAAIPNSALLLADVLVPGGSTSVITANIRDRRGQATDGLYSTPTGLDGVKFMGSGSPTNALILNTSTPQQRGGRQFLPRRIEGATRLRIQMTNGATPPTGSFRVGIYDASATKITETGVVAFTGAGNATVDYAITIPSLTLEAGIYWTVLGWAISAGSTNPMSMLPLNFAGEYYNYASNTGTTTLPANLDSGFNGGGGGTALASIGLTIG